MIYGDLLELHRGNSFNQRHVVLSSFIKDVLLMYLHFKIQVCLVFGDSFWVPCVCHLLCFVKEKQVAFLNTC